MARAAMTVQRINRNGIAPTYDAGNADGHSFTNSGSQFLHVKNGDTASHDVIVQTPRTIHGLNIADLTVSIPAGEERMIGPFPQSTFGGEVLVDLSATTSMTLGVFS